MSALPPPPPPPPPMHPGHLGHFGHPAPPPPPPPPAVAMQDGGFCGRCGQPFTGLGGVCSRCGSPVMAMPRVAAAYTHPVAAPQMVPAMHRKLSHRRMLILAGSMIGVLVVGLTAVALLVKPIISPPCRYYCGPKVGSRLVTPDQYTSNTFHVSTEYQPNHLTIAGSDDHSVTFVPANGPGQEQFVFFNGSNLDDALTQATNSLSDSQFQDLQQISEVRGAEIGQVLGKGTAYTATVTPADGSSTYTASVVVMAATSQNVTVAVVAYSVFAPDPVLKPYGMDSSIAEHFDYPVSNFRFPGQ